MTGTRPVPPFEMRDGTLGLQYRLVELELRGMVDALADVEVHAVVGALTITSARGQQVNF